MGSSGPHPEYNLCHPRDGGWEVIQQWGLERSLEVSRSEGRRKWRKEEKGMSQE